MHVAGQKIGGTSSPTIEKRKEVKVENYAGYVHQYIIDVPVLGKVFTYSEDCDRETEPRYLESKKHYQYNVENGDAAPQVIPLEAVGSFDAEERFYFFHYSFTHILST